MKREAVNNLNKDHEVSIRRACKALGFSQSSHYESARNANNRHEAEAPLVESIKKVQEHRYKRFYGSPRMADELLERGHDTTKSKTARIMRKYGLAAKRRKRFVRTTDSKHKEPVAKNILNRDFDVAKGSKTWCADITYLRTTTGWLYLAAVLNLRTRKWVGYAVAPNMKTGLVNAALDMALYQESEHPELMHADRGVQYASFEHRNLLEENGITLSMSRKGNCWDNSAMESFFGTFKNEVSDTFIDEDDAKAAVFDFQAFYNRERRHSTLNNQSPLEFEKQLKTRAA